LELGFSVLNHLSHSVYWTDKASADNMDSEQREKQGVQYVEDTTQSSTSDEMQSNKLNLPTVLAFLVGSLPSEFELSIDQADRHYVVNSMPM
jgi:hypothetical protein